MDSAQWTRVKRLFVEALERPAGRRRGWLAEAADHDPELIEEVGSLLEAHERAEGFLSTPVAVTPPGELPLEGARLGPYRIVEVIGQLAPEEVTS